ncbi:MAG: TetR/AcrR family transcriptional regulator [Bacteroidetes bacterium]|nr:TetR/AcrR family transcriptional regulator [Bacteroidota bacterium]
MSNTREFIIDEAYKLFLKRSYEAVSISDISRAIGFTKGALYHHFVNKEDLFKAVVDKYLNIIEFTDEYKVITLAEYLEIGVGMIHDIIKRLFHPNPEFKTIDYLALSIDAMRHYPGFIGVKGRFLELEIERTKVVLDNAIAKGEIRDDIDTMIMARNFHFLFLGIAGNLIHLNSPDRSISLLREQLSALYNVLKK